MARARASSRLPKRYSPLIPGTQELNEDEKEYAIQIACGLFGAMNPANADVYEPRDHQRVPKAGAWALITRRLPPMEGGLDEHVRPGRLFYLEHLHDADEKGFRSGEYKVRLASPWGELCLWPYEYTVMDPTKIVRLWADGLLTFHPTHVEQARMTAIMFYARSRGIGMADAAVMALGTISAPIGWFEPSLPKDAAAIDAMCGRINQWPWDTTKRRAAQARKTKAKP